MGNKGLAFVQRTPAKPLAVLVASAQDIENQLVKLTERVAVHVAMSVYRNLDDTTPRDTTWAASNWMPSIGSPFLRPTGPLDRNPTPQAAAIQASFQSQAVAALANYRLSSGPIFITNNAPYILELNDGKSPQAPPFFVQRAISKAVTSDLRGLRP